MTIRLFLVKEYRKAMYLSRDGKHQVVVSDKQRDVEDLPLYVDMKVSA